MKRNFTSSNSVWSVILTMVLMLASQSAWAEYVKLTALSGTGGTGGEGYASLVDGKVGTKMGHSFDPNNAERAEAWIVVKAEKAVVPNWYFLVTGSDTGTYPTRNWKKWNIYGGNFASDADAVRNGNGWTLIDERDGDALPQANSKEANFQFNSADGQTAYQYYWIEILESVQGSDIWLQMAEWGLGSYSDFQSWVEEQGQDVTKPIEYTILAGDRNNNDGEGLKSLFDGNYGTKWGNGLNENKKGDTSNGAFFIVKTSRPVSPDYIKLVTGTDNASWNHRNWRDWELYGIADVKEADIKRESAGWVELAAWDHVTEDVLPDKNSYEVFLPFEKKNDKKYSYFKVEIHAIMSGGGYMQMSEFTLGDEHMAKIDKANILKTVNSSVDVNKKFQKTLLDEFNAKVKAIEDAATLADAKAISIEVEPLAEKIRASISAYEDYVSTVADIFDHYNNHECLSGEGKAIIGKYLTESVAPDGTFKNGSYVYILENCLLDAEALTQEAKYANSLLEAYAEDLLEGAIDSENLNWTALDASKLDGNEGAAALFDHAYTSNGGTKWGFSGAGWGIFKCEDGQIAPTYYTLCVANDTDGSKGRQWKSWKIYGANFANDEDATRESDAWVLIDEKTDIVDAAFPTTNFSQTTFNMTNGGGSYQYYRIEVLKNRDGNTTIGSGNYTQMGELIFYNAANFRIDRNEKYEDMASFLDDQSGIYYVGLKDEYNDALDGLKMSSNGAEVNNFVAKLQNLQNQISDCSLAYEDYEAVYIDLDNRLGSLDNGTTAAWYEAYATDDVTERNALLRNGSFGWIMQGNLTLDEIKEETEYLQNMNRVANEGGMVYLSGYVVGQWGDGHPKNLVDGITGVDPETGKPIEDNPKTKLGGNIDASGKTHVIFKTLEQVNPYFYTLMTGGDTYKFQDRNWGAWDIYGANFEGDGQATVDAEGWVLVDSKNGVTKDRLKPDNLTKSPFGFMVDGEQTTTPYQYYKIVINSTFQNGSLEFKGGATQMQELTFGTEEEFNEIKQEYKDSANVFNTDVIAEQRLLDAYDEAVNEIDEIINMEVLFLAQHHLETLRDSINASANAYKHYQNTVEDIKTFLNENNLAESEALTALKDYLDGDAEPNEVYPNGAAGYIVENHELADSVILAEADFAKELQTKAVAAGYGKGVDITSLIVNRSFAEKAKDHVGGGIELTGWDGVAYSNGTNADKTMSAAEFCNEATKFDISQTLKDMKNGYYKVTLNAGFRPNGNINSFNYAAMAYANDTKTFIPVVREYMTEGEEGSWQGSIADKPIYMCDVDEFAVGDSTVVGYVIWGVQGSCNAFVNGRYPVTMVAKVTDGTLKFGLKNEGTSVGGDWTSAGNFGLVYLGEEEADAAEALKEAAEYNAARINTMMEIYQPAEASLDDFVAAPNFSEAQKNVLTTNNGLATYAAVEAISAAVKDIYATKIAYVDLFNAKNKVYDKWLNFVSDQTPFEAAIYDVVDGLDFGTYADAAAAQKAKADLYAQYPDYLEFKDGKASNIDFAQKDFTYEITTTGKNPVVELTGMYEALEKGEVILAFDYMADQAVENGQILYETPNLDTDMEEVIPVLAAASDWTTVYVTVAQGVYAKKYGSALNHALRWNISTTATKDDVLSLSVRNFRFMTVADMEAAGGKTLNTVKGGSGDVKADNIIDGADIVALVNMVVESEYEFVGDLNCDGTVDGADIVALVNKVANPDNDPKVKAMIIETVENMLKK